MYSRTSDQRHFQTRTGSHATKGTARGGAPFNLPPQRIVEDVGVLRAMSEMNRLASIQKSAASRGDKVTMRECVRSMRIAQEKSEQGEAGRQDLYGLTQLYFAARKKPTSWEPTLKFSPLHRGLSVKASSGVSALSGDTLRRTKISHPSKSKCHCARRRGAPDRKGAPHGNYKFPHQRYDGGETLVARSRP